MAGSAGPTAAGAIGGDRVARSSPVTLLGGGLWLFSDRADVAQKARSRVGLATERAAADDLRDMARWLEESPGPRRAPRWSGPAAGWATVGSADLRRVLVQGTRDLELQERLEAIRLRRVRAVFWIP